MKAGVPTGTMSEIAMVLTAVSSRDTGYKELRRECYTIIKVCNKRAVMV